jgi:prepilin-type N-terminal cleavage/methylation domain-containing protein
MMMSVQLWHGRPGHASDRRGFTMIELIVALGMVAVIAASLSSTLWTAYHATRQAEAAAAPSDRVDAAFQILSGDLQNALQPQLRPASYLVGIPTTATNDEQTAFLGTQNQDNRGHAADQVVFFTTADSPVHVYANGEIKSVQYLVIQPNGSSDHVLVRRVTRNLLPPDGQTASTDEEIICTGVSSFTLQYSYDGITFNPSSMSPDSWDASQEDNTIPAAVKVTLALDETQPNGKTQTASYSRIILLPCSTASLDTNVNTGTAGL